MLPTATCHSIKSRPRLHIREICEICERIKIYSKFTFYLLSKTTHIIYFPNPEPPKAQIREICEICERIKIYSNLLPIYFQYLLSHRIHEVALGAREDEDGEEEGDAHEDGAVEETTPVEGATA